MILYRVVPLAICCSLLLSTQASAQSRENISAAAAFSASGKSPVSEVTAAVSPWYVLPPTDELTTFTGVLPARASVSRFTNVVFTATNYTSAPQRRLYEAYLIKRPPPAA